MKRLTMIVVLLLMAAMPMMAEHVTPETAQKVAANFLGNNGAKVDQLTDVSEAAGFANLYIFNSEEGFVVMAADNCVQPILGYSLTGKFVAEGMPDHLRWWLQGYSDQIQEAIDHKAETTPDVAGQWEAWVDGTVNRPKSTHTVVAALITTAWDQWYPYNYYCPSCDVYSANGGHALTGCVATAMAQAINYHSAPVHGVGSYGYTHGTFGQLSADFNATNYDWANMSAQISSSSSANEIQAVATLIYHCGISVEMDYGKISSGASSSRIAPALKSNFNFSQSTTYVKRSNYGNTDWVALMRNELNNSRPVIYGGFDDATNPQSGHSFVCDGYDSDNYGDLYFHFNWGWSGSYNGYFSIDDMTPGGSGAGGGNHNYSFLQDAVIGVKPSTNNAIPTNLTYTLIGLQGLTLNWTAADGAVSYNIYRNDSYVGNTTSNTYSETAPFGTNVYYVRSVDSEGELSLSSNTVTVTVDYQTPVVNDLNASYADGDATLTWTAPAWCYPSSASATLTYGTQTNSGYCFTWDSSSLMYWGHRYLTDNLSPYDGMKLYSVDFHANNEGTYQLCFYQGTNQGTYVCPATSIYTTQDITVTATGWQTIDLPEPITLDASKDLWIFVHNPQAIDDLQSYLCTESGSSAYGVYYSADPQSYTFNNASGYAFLLKTYLTDGTYIYNLYDNGVSVANDIDATEYTVSNPADNTAHQFTVTTNYYGGESDASNLAGLTLGTASLSDLQMAANDKMTLTEGSILTVNGTVSNSNEGHLVLENGAQLFHSSEGVKATVKKDIAAYTTDDNSWYLIASPVTESITPSADNGLLANEYDLYKFDQSQELEWRNFEASAFPTLDHKTGYLYANSGNTTIDFAGTLAATTEATHLTYDDNATFKGFNLIGNPYPCNTTVDKDYYIINGNTVVLAESGHVITPCEAIFAQASAENESVTFSKAGTSGKAASSSFDITLTQRSQAERNGVLTSPTTLDRARVRFNSTERLEKFSLNDDQGSLLYIPQGSSRFAVACADGQDEMPLNFKAAQDGTYTLTVETGDLELAYLHLIDHLTGADIDLLQTLTYTFDATTRDYASRFKFVFTDNHDDTPDIDLYFVQGKTQILDVTGRVVATDRHAQLTPGVYILKTVDGNQTKSQKIIIK